MINLYIDENYSSLYFLDKDKYNITYGKENFVIDSTKEDDNIYVKTYRSSWCSSKKNVIDMTREHDLDMLKNIKDFGINVPNYLYCNNTQQYYRHMKDSQAYILKSFGSARTIGQMFVTKENIQEILSDSCDLDCEEFNKKYDIDLSTCKSKSSKEKLHESIRNGNFYLSEKQLFNSEYRIIYCENTEYCDFIIEQRFGYQIHSEEKRKHKVINGSCLYNNFDFLKTLQKFGDSHFSPVLSFDVWITEKEWGVFEYSTEFGTIYTDHNKKLENQINRVFDQRIIKLLSTK